MKNKRVQLVRGLLALVVILVHVLPIKSIELKVFVRPFTNMAVAGFIFLSGYLTKLKINTKVFYKKRILAVLIPYILFTLFYTILGQYKQGIAAIATGFAKNLITTQAKMILYYLVVYMQLVLLTPLLVKIVKQKSRALSVSVLLIQPLFILCFYIGVVQGNILKEAPWYMMVFPMWILYYYLGLLIGNNQLKIKTKNWILVLLAACGILLQVSEGLFWLHNTNVKDMYFSQARISSMLENIPILLLIANYISKPKNEANKLLCKFGDASFGIYLLHPAFIMVSDKLIERNNATFLLIYLLVATGSFVTILVINKVIPKKILKYCGLALS